MNTHRLASMLASRHRRGVAREYEAAAKTESIHSYSEYRGYKELQRAHWSSVAKLPDTPTTTPNRRNTMNTEQRLFLQWKIAERHRRGTRRQYITIANTMTSSDDDYRRFCRLSDAYNQSRIVSHSALEAWMDSKGIHRVV